MHRITQLEELLYLDTKGTERERLTSMLNAEKVRLETLLRKGCAPAQYRRATQQLTAIQHAQTVVNAIWCSYHGPLPSLSQKPVAPIYE